MEQLLPANTYTAQAVDDYLSQTKEGKEQIVVKFMIVGGQYDGKPRRGSRIQARPCTCSSGV